MEIVTENLLEGAKRAKGTAVIIDVFRAATTAAYIMKGGAKEIVLARSFEEAYELKKMDPRCVLVGEEHGLPVPGFDFGNSPYEVSGKDFSGKKVVMKTSSGTAGILAASGADEILFAGFVNAGATAEYIRKMRPKRVTLVAMGWEGKEQTEEDEACVEYIKALLSGNKPDYDAVKERLRHAHSSMRFFSGEPHWPEQDFHCAMALDFFGCVIKADKRGNSVVLVRA